jgi:eukaryotic-like serine/threonine-protein kinase
LLPIVDGLRMAHDKGIVHRDIKPDNVFLAADALGRRQPKLLDFGIAKVDKQADGRLTQIGAVLGSPDYMSPEQALGLDDIDERTDLWSLCIVLYELITGALPFQKSNYNALMHAIINEDPTSSLDRGAGDKSLWEIIQRGLRKRREERFQSATELGEAMALWLYEHGIKEDLSGNSIRAVWLDAGLLQDNRGGLALRPAGYDSTRTTRSEVSRPPAHAASKTTGGGTLPTLAPGAKLARRRAMYIAAPLGVLLLGGAGVWLGSPKTAASTPAPIAAPAVAAEPRVARPLVADAAPPPAEVAPIASAAPKASSAASAKPRPRAPAARKRGHDFGF